MTVTATSQLSPPDYPSEPGYSPEPDTTPLPRKETHRPRTALVANTAVVAVGAISFLGVSLSSASSDKAHLQDTVKSQGKRLANQSHSIGVLIKAAAQEQKTINSLQSKLSQDEIPSGWLCHLPVQLDL